MIQMWKRSVVRKYVLGRISPRGSPLNGPVIVTGGDLREQATVARSKKGVNLLSPYGRRVALEVMDQIKTTKKEKHFLGRL